MNNQEGSPNDITYFLTEEKATEMGMQLYVAFQRRFFSSCAERGLSQLKQFDTTENQIPANKQVTRF